MTVEVRRNVSEQNVIIFQFELEFCPLETQYGQGEGDKQSGKTGVYDCIICLRSQQFSHFTASSKASHAD